MVQTAITEIVYNVIKHRLPGIPLDDFERIFSRFTFHPVLHDNQPIGAIMQDGTEMHVVIKPEFRGRWAGKAELEVMQKALKDYGEIVSNVMNDHEAGHIFAKRLGFKEIGRTDKTTQYKRTAT